MAEGQQNLMEDDMNSKTALRKMASRALYYGALMALVNGFGAFTWAQKTIVVNPGQNLQALVNRYPTSTTFSLAPGIYRLRSVVLKSYDSFIGETGAVLSGADQVTGFTWNALATDEL
jgi:hypothetical protein